MAAKQRILSFRKRRQKRLEKLGLYDENSRLWAAICAIMDYLEEEENERRKSA